MSKEMQIRQAVRCAIVAFACLAVGVRNALAADTGEVERLVRVNTAFVEFQTTDLDSLVREDKIDVHSLKELWRQGKGHLVSHANVVTRRGQEAVAKCVTEFIYPTLCRSVTKPLMDPYATSTGVVVEPGGFQTREVGVILQVVPELSSDNNEIINLTLNPQVVELQAWHRFNLFGERALDPEIPAFLQPFFAVHSCSTSISITNGASYLIGGATGEAVGRTTFLFFSARTEPVSIAHTQEREGLGKAVGDRHIEISVSFVEFKTIDVEPLVREDRVRVDTLQDLWRRGVGRLAGTATVCTKAGQEAVVKGVCEFIYPTDYSIPTGMSNAVIRGAVSSPGSFQTREVGMILQCVPEIVADDAIRVVMNPQIVRAPEFHEFTLVQPSPGKLTKWPEVSYGFPFFPAYDTAQAVLLTEQPFFPVKSVSTSITLTNGATVLLGGATDERRFGRSTYTFMTARFVDTEGMPLVKSGT